MFFRRKNKDKSLPPAADTLSPPPARDVLVESNEPASAVEDETPLVVTKDDSLEIEQQTTKGSDKASFFKRAFGGKAKPEDKTKPEALAPEDLADVVSDIPASEVVHAQENLASDESLAPSGSWITRIKKGLSRTGNNFSKGLGRLILGKKTIDADLLEQIETQLLVADVGMEATSEIIGDLTERVKRKQLADSGALYQALKQSLADLLKQVEAPLVLSSSAKPQVILVVGVNGVGKTTTIGKLAKRLQAEGKSVMLAAGDTFRAAAVEQLQVWGERNKVAVVAQHTGADSASVIFDAIQSAQSRGIDVVIADTAGRLHNKSNLMDELSKVKRVMAKLDATAPHEVLLVLDAGTGQNAINQAQQFIDAAGVSGIALTKLDGTAKGGIIFALSKKFGIPVRYIGVGEGIEDLQPFNAESFIEALFDESE